MDDAQPIGCAAPFRTEARRVFRRASFFAVSQAKRKRRIDGARAARAKRRGRGSHRTASRHPEPHRSTPTQTRHVRATPSRIAARPQRGQGCLRTAAPRTQAKTVPIRSTAAPKAQLPPNQVRAPNRREAHPAPRQSHPCAAPRHLAPRCRKTTGPSLGAPPSPNRKTRPCLLRTAFPYRTSAYVVPRLPLQDNTTTPRFARCEAGRCEKEGIAPLLGDAELFLDQRGDVRQGSLVEIGQRTRRHVENDQIAACLADGIDVQLKKD